MINFCVFFSPAFESRARVCIDSIRRYHPDAFIHPVSVVSDAQPGTYIQGFQKTRFKWMRQKLATFSRPDRLVFVGADCRFYAPAQSFLNLASNSNIVLVPHVITPPAVNGASYYQTGHANGDLFSFSPAAIPILDWLIEQDMGNRPQDGIFYEQTWLSALPFIADDVAIYRRPDVNLAWFNAHERELTYVDSRYLVNGQPLIMAHFTGYQKGMYPRMSRYGSGGDNKSPALLQLIKEYDALI